MPLAIPNLTLLKQFVAVAESKGISSAAARLHISQPALSKNVRRLEAMLGTQLFERHSRGAELTPVGLAFYNRAQVIGLEYEHALQDIRNLLSKQDGVFRVAAGSIWSNVILPAAASRFHKRFPLHRLIVRTSAWEQQIEELRRGRVDIFAGPIVRSALPPGFASRRIAKAQLGIMCARSHPLARVQGPLDAMSLSDLPFVSFSVDSHVLKTLSDYLKARGAPPPRHVVESDSLYTCVELARSGDYLFYESTMIADSPIGAGLTVLPTDDVMWQYDMGLAYREGLGKLAPYNGFMKAMAEVLNERGPRNLPSAL